VVNGRIDRIVEAVSDGERVDWGAVRRRLSDSLSVDYCTHLETVSKIGRGAHQPEDTPSEVPQSLWVSIVLAIAWAQIGLGLVGAIAYRPQSLVNGLRLLLVLSFAGMGFVLRRSRHNRRARDLGAAFVLCALGFSRNPYVLVFDAWFTGMEWLAPLRTGVAVDAWAPYFFWQFARRFPTTERFALIDRTGLFFARVTSVVGTLLFLNNLVAAALEVQKGLVWAFSLNQDGQRFYSATIFGLALPVLPLIFIRARSAAAQERARVRVFAIAMVAGIAPAYVEVILEALSPAYLAILMSSVVIRNVVTACLLLPLLALPFITGYSILIHRLLDVRIVIRQGLRYLLAKWTLAALTFMPFALLLSYVYQRRHESVVDVISDGWDGLLLALVVLGGGLLAGRTLLLRALDRWFDRRGTDRTTVLARSGDALRLVRTRSELVASIGEAAANALNTTAVIHFFDSRRQAYIPFGRGGLSLPSESALATIMMQESNLPALHTDGDHSIAPLLPHTERLWVREHGACLVVPIRSSGVERAAALLVLGPRGDAMGYTVDDERFVTALASATGIAFDNLRLRSDTEDQDDFGLLCLRCHQVTDFTEQPVPCPCGGTLQAAAVPRQINGKFRVEALLGSGGMGVAYLASDLALNRRVAIKTLPLLSADAMIRLGQEARLMAALSHPNLATILGYESWRGTPILVCEYLAGGTLQQQLARAALPVGTALTLGATLLQALEYMHVRGVLHRDIKPSNIAFASDGTPKLLDFGVAGLTQQAAPAIVELTSTAARLSTSPAGTWAYLPPQAFRGEAPTTRFDLWGLGVVLFEVITGQHPFADGDDTVHNICRGRFVAEFDADVPDSVRAFLSRALSPHTDHQFHSSSEMREALMEVAHPSLQEKEHHVQ
jgi:hypothetical protein